MTSMKVLALDTSTSRMSVALTRSGETICEINLMVKTGHAGMILPVIDEVLSKGGTKRDELGLIAVGTGPGSFTGIRIGLATAKGLAEALHCPIIGISTLDTIARAAQPSPLPVMPILDAKKGAVFCALYAGDGARITNFMNLRPDAIATLVEEDTLFIGNGCGLYRDVLKDVLAERYHEGPAHLWHPHASVLGLLACEMPQRSIPIDVLPIYVRASDATLLLEKKGPRP